MANGALQSGLRSNEIFIFHKQVETGKTGNISEQPEALLKTSTVDHQGRFTMKPLDK